MGANTLSSRIALLGIQATLAASLLIGAGAYVVVRHVVTTNIQGMVGVETANATARITRFLDMLSSNLHGLSANSIVANSLVDNVGRQTYLQPFLADFTRITGVQGRIALVDYRGRSIGRSGTDRWVGGVPWIAEAIAEDHPRAGIATVDDAAALVLVDPVTYANTGAAEGALVLAVPLKELGTRELAANSKGIVHRLVFPAAPDAPAADGATVSTPVQVSGELAALTPVLHTTVDPHLVSEPLQTMAAYIGLVAMAVVALVGLAGLRMARTLAAPLAELSSAAAAVDFGAEVPRLVEVQGGTAEVDQLGATIREMVHRLSASYHRLERNSRALLRNAERIANVGSWRWRPGQPHMTWSEKVDEILGVAAVESFTLARLTEAVHPDDRHLVEDAFARMKNGGEVTDLDVRLADGERVARLNGRMTAGDGTDPPTCDGTLQDITEAVMARRRVEEARRRLQAILDSAPVGLAILSFERELLLTNRLFGQIFGFDEDITGQRSDILYGTQEQYEDIGRRAYPLLKGGDIFHDTVLMRRRDGSSIWCSLTARLVDVAEPAAGAVWVVEDVTSRKQAQEALVERENLFRQMFEAGAAIKLLIDPADGIVVDANPAAAHFYGYGLDTLRGMRMAEINTLPPDQQQTNMAAAVTNQRGYFQFRHRLADGTIRDVEVYTARVEIQGRPLIMSIVHDITERVSSQAALAEAHARLEGQAKELARSNAELEQFAYVASHDLRQPLRQIGSYLTLLKRRAGDKLEGDETTFLDYAVNGAKRMDGLILSLLEYSRVGRHALGHETVPLGEAVAEALENLQLAIRDAGATVTVAPGLPTVGGDRNELVRLFQNLVGNAIKYSRPGVPAQVRVEARDDGDTWQVEVTDNGIGIADEHRERIFGIFQRLVTADQYEGTGIGLAVCRKIVEHHHGHIWVEAAPEQGSRFCLQLPKTLPSAAE
ncbi:MAG: PAS domain S-box protein [Actinomycetota bacterium]